MMKELYENPACSVTKELVEYIADSNPKLFKPTGRVNVGRVLFYLGFRVRQGRQEGEGLFTGGYKIIPDVYVRDNTQPTKAYKTTIYAGNVRKEIVGFENGVPVYEKREYHRMWDLYQKYEVLTVENVRNHPSYIDVKELDNGRY